MSQSASKLGTLFRWASLACLIGGGALWALSPLGVRLSELKFKTPEVFWKLFVSAPLTLILGLVGLYLMGGERRGLAARVGLWATFAGLLLVVAGSWLATGGRLPRGAAPVARHLVRGG